MQGRGFWSGEEEVGSCLIKTVSILHNQRQIYDSIAIGSFGVDCCCSDVPIRRTSVS